MAQTSGEEFSIDQYILHHVENTHEWQLPFLPAIPLPEPLSLHLIMIFIACGILFLLFGVLFKKKGEYPQGGWTNFLEAIVIFIRDEISIECLGEEDGRRMTPVFCTFFFLILTLNLMGLIPLFSTATANYNVTGGLMLATFSFMTIGAIKKNGIKGFFYSFVPSDVPLPLLLFLVPLEMLIFVIKSCVLMIRLFANLLGGHCVLLSLTGMTALLGIVVLPVVTPVVLFVYVLEIFVAFLQAYIFTVLSALFIGHVYHPEH